MISNQNKECLICLYEIKGDEKLIDCPNPNPNQTHSYHSNCLKQWQKTSLKNRSWSFSKKNFNCLYCCTPFNLEALPSYNEIKKCDLEYERKGAIKQLVGKALVFSGMGVLSISFFYLMSILRQEVPSSLPIISAIGIGAFCGSWAFLKGAEIYVEGGKLRGERHQE